MGLFDFIKKKAGQFGINVDALDSPNLDSVKKAPGDLNGDTLKKKARELGLSAEAIDKLDLGDITSKVKAAFSKPEPEAPKPAPAASRPEPKPASKPAPASSHSSLSMEGVGKFIEGFGAVKKVHVSDKLVVGYLHAFTTNAGDVLVEPFIRVYFNDEGLNVVAEFSLPSNIAGGTYECDDYQCREIKDGLSAAVGNLFDKSDYSNIFGVSVKALKLFRIDDLHGYDQIAATIRAGIAGLVKEAPEAANIRIRHINSTISETNRRLDERVRAEAEHSRRLEQERKQREEQERRSREQARRRTEAEDRKEADMERRRGLNQSFSYTLMEDGMVRNLQEAFSEDYPYLRIGVYMVKTSQGADKGGGSISPFDKETLFGDIRSFKGRCEVEISGGDSPKDLEAHFRKVSGLVIKICDNDEDDNRYYIAKDSKWYTMPIYDIGHAFRDKGYQKADIS